MGTFFASANPNIFILFYRLSFYLAGQYKRQRCVLLF